MLPTQAGEDIALEKSLARTQSLVPGLSSAEKHATFLRIELNIVCLCILGGKENILQFSIEPKTVLSRVGIEV